MISFYDNLEEEDVERTPISPYFSLSIAEIKKMVTGAFRRSNFQCYERIHRILAHHLQKIIELPEEEEEALKVKTRKLLDSAIARMDFVRVEADCQHCRTKKKCKE